MDADAASSRSKAAAWVWYQRAGCHLGLSVRPECFASSPDRRPRPPPSPSRFKLEAAPLLTSLTNQKQEAKAASLESEGLVSFLLPANLSTDVNDRPTEIDPPRTSAAHKKTVSLAPDDDGISSSSSNLVLALSYAGVAAAWDCGSSLFDSFELVAVSKKLECAHQFNAFSMDKVWPPAPNIMSAALDEQQEDEDEEIKPADSVEVLPCNEPAFFPPTALASVEGPIGDPRPHGQINSEFKPTSHPDQKHRKQEVYDIFCRYDCKGCGCDDVNYDDVKKPKPSPAIRQAMPRLRRLSKAFRRIAHLAHSSVAHREHSISQRPHLQSHRLRLVPSPKTQQLLPHYNRIAVHGTARNAPSAGPVRDRAPANNMFNRNNKYSDHMQHQKQQHHHHHYHYLFHHDSDEGVGALQPTLAGANKSFMVAAAGLRTPRVSALQRHPPFNGSSCKMDGAVLDYKRKWRDLNAASPPQSKASTV